MSAAATPERYWLTKTFAVCLTGVVAIYGAWGWLQVDQVFKAILCLVAQGLANGCAVLARRSLDKGRPALAVGMGILTAGCAFWSGEGLHHAWTLDGSEISLFWVIFIAALEPIMFWGVEEVQLTPSKTTTEQQPVKPVAKARPFDLVRASAAGASLLAAAPAAFADVAAPATTTRTAPTPPRAFRPLAMGDEDRRNAFAMIDAGATPTEVFRVYPDISLNTLKRWRKVKLKNASIPLAEAA